MLLHLDSYDLINVFKNTTIQPDDLRRQLFKRNTKLVYSPETVQEVVKPTDVAESRSRLETLTTFPNYYIREKKLVFRREFVCAIAAFQSNELYRTREVDPFVSTWQEVDEGLSSKYGISKDCLVEIVLPLLTAEPDRFRNRPEDLNALMANVAVDRDRGNDFRRGSRKVFRDAVGDTLIRLGLHPQQPSEDFVDDFSAWLLKRPSVCPSWRLMGETYSEFANNLGDKGQLGDPPDFAHVSVTPYVDVITLDRRMSGYVKTAVRRLTEAEGAMEYATKVFSGLSEWLDSGI
jgi:hypothetical protein